MIIEDLYCIKKQLKLLGGYYEKKQYIRNIAIQWQSEYEAENYYYSEIAEFSVFFSKLGREYGLLREFRENAIC